MKKTQITIHIQHGDCEVDAIGQQRWSPDTIIVRRVAAVTGEGLEGTEGQVEAYIQECGKQTRVQTLVAMRDIEGQIHG